LINTGRCVKRRFLLHTLLILGFVFPVAYGEPAGTYSDDEGRMMLRSELDEFGRYTESTMKAAREILISRAVSPGDLKKLDAWQSAQRTEFNQALLQQDPLVALADAWAVSKSLTRYLNQEGSATELPGTVREVALDMLKRREDRLLYIASRYLPVDSVAALSQGIETFTDDQSAPEGEASHPDARRWTAPLFSVWAKGQATVGSVLQVPLMPGRALKGVSDSGKALTGIRETTADAIQVANQLPENIRTEFQIALTNLFERRAEIIEILSAVDSVSTNVRAAAESSRLTAEQVNEMMGLADSASVSLRAAAESTRLAVAEIRGLAELNRASEKPEGVKPFDIRDYGAAAESIQYGAAEVCALLGELRAISEDEELSRRMGLLWAEADAVAEKNAARVRQLIDHFALRLIGVTVIGFVLACTYALLRMKLMRKPT
jgi:hypothetical protein